MKTIISWALPRRFLLFVFVLSSLWCLPMYAQGRDDTEDSNPFREGAWALQFQIANNFTLSNFQGSILSVKRHLSPRKAVRLGLSLRAVLDETKDVSTAVRNGDPEERQEQSGDDTQVLVGVTTQLIRYPTTTRKINPYWGLGPRVEYSRNESNDHGPDFEEFPRTVRTRESWVFGVGLNGVLGAEWLVQSNIGINAEYGAVLQYAHRVQKAGSKTTSPESPFRDEVENKNTLNQVFLGSSSVKFGVPVYF